LPIQVVQRLMRHTDIRRTVNLYMDLGLDDLAREISQLPPLFAVVPPAGHPATPTEERKAQ